MQIDGIIYNSSYRQSDSAFLTELGELLKNAESDWRYDELCMMSSICMTSCFPPFYGINPLPLFLEIFIYLFVTFF